MNLTRQYEDSESDADPLIRAHDKAPAAFRTTASPPKKKATLALRQDKEAEDKHQQQQQLTSEYESATETQEESGWTTGGEDEAMMAPQDTEPAAEPVATDMPAAVDDLLIDYAMSDDGQDVDLALPQQEQLPDEPPPADPISSPPAAAATSPPPLSPSSPRTLVSGAPEASVSPLVSDESSSDRPRPRRAVRRRRRGPVIDRPTQLPFRFPGENHDDADLSMTGDDEASDTDPEASRRYDPTVHPAGIPCGLRGPQPLPSMHFYLKNYSIPG
jgi:hypothetical protein